jgi:glucokinase
MLLAGDIGGTKTLLGLFDEARPRPRLVTRRSYETNAFDSFSAILDAFARDVGVCFPLSAAAAGVAGPVIGDRAELSNIDWDISSREIANRCSTSGVRLLNDLEAMANSVEVLTEDELSVLQAGVPRADGNAVVIAAGTGLGEAYLHRVNARLGPVASEGGHADWAARTDPEVGLLEMLRGDYGRAEVEHVLSGPGLRNIHRFTHDGEDCHPVRGLPADQVPAAISGAALEGRCPKCVEALSMFVSAYGAEAGNLALRGMATAGVFIGGGIAPKVLELLTRPRFLEVFRDKAPMTKLIDTIPLKVILNPQAGLLGAATVANTM